MVVNRSHFLCSLKCCSALPLHKSLVVLSRLRLFFSYRVQPAWSLNNRFSPSFTKLSIGSLMSLMLMLFFSNVLTFVHSFNALSCFAWPSLCVSFLSSLCYCFLHVSKATLHLCFVYFLSRYLFVSARASLCVCQSTSGVEGPDPQNYCVTFAAEN